MCAGACVVSGFSLVTGGFIRQSSADPPLGYSLLAVKVQPSTRREGGGGAESGVLSQTGRGDECMGRPGLMMLHGP